MRQSNLVNYSVQYSIAIFFSQLMQTRKFTLFFHSRRYSNYFHFLENNGSNVYILACFSIFETNFRI